MSHKSRTVLVTGEGESPRWQQANASCVPLRWKDPDYRLQSHERETTGIVGYGRSSAEQPHYPQTSTCAVFLPQLATRKMQLLVVMHHTVFIHIVTILLCFTERSI